MKKLLFIIAVLLSMAAAAQTAPLTKVGDWSAATNTPTLPNSPTLAAGEYYECSADGTFLGIQFIIGDYIYARDGSYQKLDSTDPLVLVAKQVNSRITAQIPVTITPISGGSQNSTSTGLATVTGSSMDLDASSWYDVEWKIVYSAAATTTGAFFSSNGTVGGDFLTGTVLGDVVNTDSPIITFNAANGGRALPSSRATTLNLAVVRVRIHTTTAGTIVLRFATEVNASAITITGLTGYKQKLN